LNISEDLKNIDTIKASIRIYVLAIISNKTPLLNDEFINLCLELMEDYEK
jgi:hypothetical protein